MPKQKTLYQLLSEREIERMAASDIKDVALNLITIGELQHIGCLLDNRPNMNAVEALTILTARESA